MKQISSRFSIAVHALSLIAQFPSQCTGEFIAGSVNTNPVIVRKMIAMLKKAGLVTVRPGVGGTSLTKAPEDISLLDVYRAVGSTDDGELFNFHDAPNPLCPVGQRIEGALRSHMREAQLAMERKLAGVTLRQLIAEMQEQSNTR
ncbi:Rrf2 family transcriptional regulator [Paenibacillus sp.]|uniref:Rrf2 family transcriptional regulator n=1 Tax=Paenibacillus sp. TaxID=58172 RepID=UPI002D6DEFEC|nr:Rrf2 family transcriptional regulator [Paenibacillus sp.]HZG85664.1 Rrf2 family transcriptional regulator [Paenibacillus sp.]